MRRPEVGCIALAMLVSACAVPSEVPNWDVTWNLPINVDDLGIDLTDVSLPSGITIDSSGTPFVRTGFSASTGTIPAIVRNLATQCPTCPNGTAPKPQFTAPLATTTVSLTAGSNLQSATLISGTGGSEISVVLNNGFGFDPINPPGGSPGTITITVVNGTTTLGTLTLQGGTHTIPSGATRTFPITLSGTISSSQPIEVRMTMDSPPGSATQPVTMSPTQLFTATPTATIKIATAAVTIAANPIDPSIQELPDLAELSEIANRVEDVATPQGAMILSVNNPLSIATNAVLTFTGTKTEEDGTVTTIQPVQKNVSLPAGGGAASNSTVTISLTGQELRRLLGASVTATFSGSTVAGTTVVTPNARITTTARMRMRLFVKEVE